jgi:hypothetical protein
MIIKPVFRLLPISALCLFFTGSVWGDVASDWGQDAAFAQAAEGQAAGQGSAQINKSETTIPGFTSNPSEEQYYNDTPAQLSQATSSAATTDPNAQNMVAQFNSGNQIPINSNTPMVQTGATIQQNVAQIISGSYPGCSQHQQCQGGTTEHTCESSRSLQLNCTNTLNVTVNYQPYNFDCNHVVTGSNMQYTELPGPDSNGNCVTGFMQVFTSVAGNYQNSGTVQATLPPGVTGQVFMTLRGLDYNQDFKPGKDQLSLQETGNGVASASIVTPPFADPDVLWGTTTSNFTVPTSTAPVNVSYNWSLVAKGGTGKYAANPINGIQPAVIYISYPYTTFNVPTVNTAWVNSCGNIPSACTQSSETCTDKSGTKTINGDPVTEPCWQYSQIYQCNGPTVPDGESCAAYQNTCNAISTT